MVLALAEGLIIPPLIGVLPASIVVDPEPVSSSELAFPAARVPEKVTVPVLLLVKIMPLLMV